MTAQVDAVQTRFPGNLLADGAQKRLHLPVLKQLGIMAADCLYTAIEHAEAHVRAIR